MWGESRIRNILRWKEGDRRKTNRKYDREHVKQKKRGDGIGRRRNMCMEFCRYGIEKINVWEES